MMTGYSSVVGLQPPTGDFDLTNPSIAAYAAAYSTSPTGIYTAPTPRVGTSYKPQPSTQAVNMYGSVMEEFIASQMVDAGSFGIISNHHHRQQLQNQHFAKSFESVNDVIGTGKLSPESSMQAAGLSVNHLLELERLRRGQYGGYRGGSSSSGQSSQNKTDVDLNTHVKRALEVENSSRNSEHAMQSSEQSDVTQAGSRVKSRAEGLLYDEELLNKPDTVLNGSLTNTGHRLSPVKVHTPVKVHIKRSPSSTVAISSSNRSNNTGSKGEFICEVQYR